MAVSFIPLNSQSSNNIATNFQRVNEALQDTLSRSGDGPNQMNADIDMNSNDVLNVGTLQVDDITIDGTDPTGILERALDAVEEAELAADEAEEFKDETQVLRNQVDALVASVRNDWVINGPFVGTGSQADYQLLVNPGSANNMLPVVGGVTQVLTDNSYSLVVVATIPYIRINVPAGIPFEVRTGNAIAVNTPTAGSVGTAQLATDAVTTVKILDANVTTAKVANDAITFAKMQNINTGRLLGRTTAASGDPEEVTPALVRDNFFPIGASIDSQYANLAGAFSFTALIPIDNTIPQIGEGTAILGGTIQPKKTTNKLRATVNVTFVGTAIGPVVIALFSAGAANAIYADLVSVATAGGSTTCSFIHEWVPGVVVPVAVSVRAGPATGFANTITVAPAYFGGVNHATLLIEEIVA